MEYIISVPGKPVAKARPRFVQGKSGRIHIFTPKSTIDYEKHVQKCYTDKYLGPISEGPLKAEIVAYMPLNKKDYQKVRGGLSKSGQRKVLGITRPLCRPDLDNIAKSVLDSLNGIAYKDDSQIVVLTVSKEYSETPGLMLTLSDELMVKKNKVSAV